MLFRILGKRRVFSTATLDPQKQYIRDEIARANGNALTHFDLLLAAMATGLCTYGAMMTSIFAANHRLRAIENQLHDMCVELRSAENKILSMEKRE